MAMFGRILSRANLLISFPVATELIVVEIRTQQCCVPTIHGRETALPSPHYSDATRFDMKCVFYVSEIYDIATTPGGSGYVLRETVNS